MKVATTRLLLLGISLSLLHKGYCQSISSNDIAIEVMKFPKVMTSADLRSYSLTISSPYNLTKDDIIRHLKNNFQKELREYDNTVSQSEKDYQQKLNNYEGDVQKAKDKYELEMTAFKKLSLLERLAITDQGRNPKLAIPSKPEYYKPYPPEYREPVLDDYIIADNAVLASQINIEGMKKGGGQLDIAIIIDPVHFQDNGGQTYISQPTKIIIKQGSVEKINVTFFNEFEFLASYPTNNINKPLEEKKHLNKVIPFLNEYLNNMYGYRTMKRTVKIMSVKNKGSYDDLERADIYITTNLKKLQADPDTSVNTVAYANMQKGIDTWLETLQKIDYKDPKADLNARIAKYIFFNLMRLNLALDRKAAAEQYLNQLQEKLVEIKLSGDEKKDLDAIEKEIYKKN